MMHNMAPLHGVLHQYLKDRPYRGLLENSDLSTQAKVARILSL